MAHTKTYIDPSLPLSLARVSEVTGNPVLDVGYQCKDSRPYFRFTGGGESYYTAVHPSSAAAETEVGVYTRGSVVKDGAEHASMEYAGAGTQSGGTLSYGGGMYTNTGAEHEDVRLFLVNKWSKCKPIRYDKKTPLTDAERQGETSDRADGYWYGVRIASQVSSWDEVHEVPFDYLAPEDGDWMRLTDFSGYDHAAAANLSGTTGFDYLVTDVEIDAAVSLLIDVAGANTTGIDILSSIMREISAGTIESAFSSMYAMALVDGYACAMKCSTGDVSPIYDADRDVWNSGFRFTPYALRDLIPGGLETGGHKFSVFLARQAGGMLDVSGAWFSVAGKVFPSRAFAVPGLTGLAVEARTLVTAPPATARITSVTQEGISITATIDPSLLVQTTHARLSLTIGTGTTAGRTEEFDFYRVGNLMQHTHFFTYSWRDDLRMMVMPGQTITGVNLRISTWYQSGVTTAGTGVLNGSVTIPE